MQQIPVETKPYNKLESTKLINFKKSRIEYLIAFIIVILRLTLYYYFFVESVQCRPKPGQFAKSLSLYRTGVEKGRIQYATDGDYEILLREWNTRYSVLIIVESIEKYKYYSFEALQNTPEWIRANNEVLIIEDMLRHVGRLDDAQYNV